jgi:hypothetical protein
MLDWLEGLSDQDPVLSFKGIKPHGLSPRKTDETLMEMCVTHSAEGMLESMKAGVAVLFPGFRPLMESDDITPQPSFWKRGAGVCLDHNGIFVSQVQ